MSTTTSLQALVERAIAIAEQHHAGQVDKAGRPYIEHPLRVMNTMSNDAERIVAVLHDVIEDTNLTLNQLAADPSGSNPARCSVSGWQNAGYH
jgi:(p)ppGpp synthase/HD superfamily hydrolase